MIPGRSPPPPARHPMRLAPTSSLLCVIDIQEKLLAVVPASERVTARSRRLAEAAALLGVASILTEQYPKGLGRTPAALAAKLPATIEKTSFSCCGCEPFRAAIPASVECIVLCGLETHVCIAQTALDLLAEGYAVFVVVDAVASRHDIDHDVALRRLDAAGAILTTSEAVLFEWCRTADHAQFKSIRGLL